MTRPVRILAHHMIVLSKGMLISMRISQIWKSNKMLLIPLVVFIFDYCSTEYFFTAETNVGDRSLKRERGSRTREREETLFYTRARKYTKVTHRALGSEAEKSVAYHTDQPGSKEMWNENDYKHWFVAPDCWSRTSNTMKREREKATDSTELLGQSWFGHLILTSDA